MQRRTAGEIMMATGRVRWGAPNLPPDGHRGRPDGSAFEAVAVIVLERLKGVLEVVRRDAFVRAALVRRGGIDERGLRIVQVPARDVDAQRDVQALALLHRHRRDQARLLALVDVGGEGEVAARTRLAVRPGHLDRDGREVGMRRDERRILARAGLVDLELEGVVGARRRSNSHLRRDGGAAERQRHEGRAGLELLAIAVVHDRVAGRDIGPLELDLPQHELDAADDHGVVPERDHGAVASSGDRWTRGGGERGAGGRSPGGTGRERKAHRPGGAVRARRENERRHQREQLHILHTSSSNSRDERLGARTRGPGWQALCRPRRAARRSPPRTTCEGSHMCSRHVAILSASNRRSAVRCEPGGFMKPVMQRDQAETFRKLHQGPELLVLPNAWDVATARLVEEAGFPAVATTSAGVAIVVNARTDAFEIEQWTPAQRLAEAVRRANAYRAAGADCLLVVHVSDAATIGRLAREIAGPLNVIAGPPAPALGELARLGVRRASLGPRVTQAALGFVRGVLAGPRGRGGCTGMAGALIPFGDLQRPL